MGGEVVILANSLISHFQWGLRHSALLNWYWDIIDDGMITSREKWKYIYKIELDKVYCKYIKFLDSPESHCVSAFDLILAEDADISCRINQ